MHKGAIRLTNPIGFVTAATSSTMLLTGNLNALSGFKENV